MLAERKTAAIVSWDARKRRCPIRRTHYSNSTAQALASTSCSGSASDGL